MTKFLLFSGDKFQTIAMIKAKNEIEALKNSYDYFFEMDESFREQQFWFQTDEELLVSDEMLQERICLYFENKIDYIEKFNKYASDKSMKSILPKEVLRFIWEKELIPNEYGNIWDEIKIINLDKVYKINGK